MSLGLASLRRALIPRAPSPLAGEGRGEGERMNRLKTFARNMRREPTTAEQRIWKSIRHRQVAGAKFRRQVPIGAYIADFVCFERRIVVEIDGGQHAESEKDQARDAWFGSQGFTVLRFWNSDVLSHLEGVLTAIETALSETPPHPGPLPRGERGLVGEALCNSAKKDKT